MTQQQAGQQVGLQYESHYAAQIMHIKYSKLMLCLLTANCCAFTIWALPHHFKGKWAWHACRLCGLTLLRKL